MDFLGFMIAFVGAIGLIVGLISILYPIRYLFIYNRLMALAVVVVSIMLVNAGSEMSPKIAAENAVKDAQSASDRQRAAFERAHAASPLAA